MKEIKIKNYRKFQTNKSILKDMFVTLFLALMLVLITVGAFIIMPKIMTWSSNLSTMEIKTLQFFKNYLYVTLGFVNFATGLIVITDIRNTIKKLRENSGYVIHKSTKSLNKVIEFNDGALAPMYEFINYRKSNADTIVITINDESGVRAILDNEVIENPLTDSEIDYNEKIKLCNKQFGYLNSGQLIDYIDENLELFEETERIKNEKRIEDNMQRQIKMKRFYNQPYLYEQLDELKLDINEQKMSEIKHLNKLQKEQDKIVQHL